MNIADGTSLLMHEEQNQKFHALSEKITTTPEACTRRLHNLTDLQQESRFVRTSFFAAVLV
jgi:hypothetical protein